MSLDFWAFKRGTATLSGVFEESDFFETRSCSDLAAEDIEEYVKSFSPGSYLVYGCSKNGQLVMYRQFDVQ